MQTSSASSSAPLASVRFSSPLLPYRPLHRATYLTPIQKANYLPLIAHLRATIKRAHKKSYTISVGKINPAKLANFLEVEAFVLVACPENSLLDAKEFLRPIVTPYELEVALQPAQTWTGRYVLDFEQLLREQRAGLGEGTSVSVPCPCPLSHNFVT